MSKLFYKYRTQTDAVHLISSGTEISFFGGKQAGQNQSKPQSYAHRSLNTALFCRGQGNCKWEGNILLNDACWSQHCFYFPGRCLYMQPLIRLLISSSLMIPLYLQPQFLESSSTWLPCGFLLSSVLPKLHTFPWRSFRPINLKIVSCTPPFYCFAFFLC